ncbi:hypothetical protein PINS_up008198 [Pythium insidiosum]|nr:hypothetical protein PINS_up008198 [Pythium insidiosum]
MKTFPVTAVLLAFAPIAWGCSNEDGTKILAWMNSCDVVQGNSAAKCADRECHKALHYLEEQETVDCYVQLGLGLSTDLDYYKQLDEFCHGDGKDPEAPVAARFRVLAPAATCSAQDGETIKRWMASCDSITTGSSAKCRNRACHNALHRLEEAETKACWVSLGLGTVADFDKYAKLDAFCHGLGPDPANP